MESENIKIFWYGIARHLMLDILSNSSQLRRKSASEIREDIRIQLGLRDQINLVPEVIKAFEGLYPDVWNEHTIPMNIQSDWEKLEWMLRVLSEQRQESRCSSYTLRLVAEWLGRNLPNEPVAAIAQDGKECDHLLHFIRQHISNPSSERFLTQSEWVTIFHTIYNSHDYPELVAYVKDLNNANSRVLSVLVRNLLTHRKEVERLASYEEKRSGSQMQRQFERKQWVEAEGQIDVIANQLDECTLHRQQLEQELQRTKEAQRTFESQLRETQTRLEQKEQDMALQMETQQNQWRTANESITQALRDCEANFGSLQLTNQSLESKLNQKAQESREVMSRMNDQLANSERLLAEARTATRLAKEDALADYSSLQSRFTTLEQQRANAIEEATRLCEKRISDIDKELQRFKHLSETDRETLSTNRTQLVSQMEQITHLQHLKDTCDANVQVLQSKLETCDEERNNCSFHLSQLQSQLTECTQTQLQQEGSWKSEIAQLRDQLEQKTKEVQTITEKAAAYHQLCTNQLQQQRQQCLQDVETYCRNKESQMLQTNQQLTSELENLRRELNDCTKKESQTLQTNQQLMSEFDHLRQELNDLKGEMREMDTLREQVTTMNQQLKSKTLELIALKEDAETTKRVHWNDINKSARELDERQRVIKQMENIQTATSQETSRLREENASLFRQLEEEKRQKDRIVQQLNLYKFQQPTTV